MGVIKIQLFKKDVNDRQSKKIVEASEVEDVIKRVHVVCKVGVVVVVVDGRGDAASSPEVRISRTSRSPG